MTDGIRLSPKHGVNPSLDQCFYCMEDKGIVLFGAMKGDAEAPRKICMDKEPCSQCKELMEQGVILISVDEDKTEDMNNPWRTGGWCVVKEDFIKRVFQPKELVQRVLEQRCAFMPDDAWDMLGLPRGETE